MNKFAATILFALLLAPQTSHAAVGKTYLTAYDKAKGSQASAGRYGRQIRLNAAPSAAPDKTSAKTSAKGKRRAGRYTQKVALCGTAYYTTKRGVAWIAAHRKAGHELVVRKHVGKRKYSILCGKVPKRVRAARKTTRKATARTQ